MSDKEIKEEVETQVDATPETIEQPAFKVFAKADYRLSCSCGADVMVAEGMSGGMRYIVPATDSHTLDIQCPECEHKFKFYYVENTTPDEIEVEEETEINNEQVLQEDTKSE